MALSRNARRKAAKARFEAKVLRQTKAKVGRERQAVKDTVDANQRSRVRGEANVTVDHLGRVKVTYRDFYQADNNYRSSPTRHMKDVLTHFSGTVSVASNLERRTLYSRDDNGKWR